MEDGRAHPTHTTPKRHLSVSLGRCACDMEQITRTLWMCSHPQQASLEEEGLCYSITKQNPQGHHRMTLHTKGRTSKSQTAGGLSFWWGQYIKCFGTIWALMSLFLSASNCLQIKEISRHALLQRAHTRLTKQLNFRQVAKESLVQSRSADNYMSPAVIGSTWCDHRQSQVGGVIISSLQVGDFNRLICLFSLDLSQQQDNNKNTNSWYLWRAFLCSKLFAQTNLILTKTIKSKEYFYPLVQMSQLRYRTLLKVKTALRVWAEIWIRLSGS